MRYVSARFTHCQREEAYRIYVTDALKALGGLDIRYADIVYGETETRTADEIIDNITSKIIKMGGEN